MKCDRCGKEFESNYNYEVTIPSFNDEPDAYIWCEDCVKEFMGTLNRPTTSFIEVEPSEILSDEDRQKWHKLFMEYKAKRDEE